MAHKSKRYSALEIKKQVEKLGVKIRDLDKNNPDDGYILAQFVFFACAQKVAKDVYGDATASKYVKKLAKSVLGMAGAPEKLAARNHRRNAEIIMKTLADLMPAGRQQQQNSMR